METVVAILMVLGIFVGVPILIGFAIVGVFLWTDRRAHRAERAEALEEWVAEAPLEQPVEV